jgi:hypothetical protein
LKRQISQLDFRLCDSVPCESPLRLFPLIHREECNRTDDSKREQKPKQPKHTLAEPLAKPGYGERGDDESDSS